MNTTSEGIMESRGKVVVICTLIICITVVLVAAIRIPVAMERLNDRLERHIARLEMLEQKHEGKQQTKQERIEQKAQ